MPTPQQGKIIVNGIVYGGTNQIDDTTTSGGTTWSSTKIYDEIVSMLPTESASGAVASFETPLTLPLVSHNVTIEPVQAGTGDPSPSNVRPISGWSEMNVTRTGKNLFDVATAPSSSAYWERNGGTFTNLITDTRATFQITVYLYKGTTSVVRVIAPFNASIGVNTKTFTTTGYDFDKIQIRHNGATQDLPISFSFGAKGTFTLSVNVTKNDPTTVGGIEFKDVQIELGTTATAYEAYNGTAYARTFLDSNDDPVTVYGGSENLKTGEGEGTFKYVDLGTLSWTKTATSGIDRFQVALPNLKGSGNNNTPCNMMCEQLKNTSWTTAATTAENLCIAGLGGGGLIAAKDDRYSTASDFKQAMSGIKLVFELETPQTFHTNPLNLDTLKGVNNIWADTGDTAVEYKQDIQTYIDSRLSSGIRTLSLAKAPVETKEETKQEEQEEQNDDAQR